MRTLKPSTLKGLWSAILSPWGSDGKIDQGILQRNCRKLAAARVDGIYTTDSDGEFYAIELGEFKDLARAFARAIEPTGIDAAIGVTWSHTQGIIDRIKAACDAGIPNVHVAFPFFMPLALADIDRFFGDLAEAVPEARWIHYAHARCGPILTGRDYARLSKHYPDQFIGTKIPTGDVSALTEILANSEHLAHFICEYTILPGILLGAKGCYSYWVNVLPRWHRAFFDACLNGRWEAAANYHKKLIKWERSGVQPLREAGHRHGIIGKARAELTGWLEETGSTRAPYTPVSKELRTRMKEAFDRYWADEIRQEDFGSPDFNNGTATQQQSAEN